MPFTEAGGTTIALEHGPVKAAFNAPVSPAGLVLLAAIGRDEADYEAHARVAAVLHEAGLATLVFDLLTDEERAGRNGEGVTYDVPLFARRLVEVTDQVQRLGHLRGLPVGYFVTGSAAAAALVAAAERRGAVSALVAAQGRPDLAFPRLDEVHAPSLFVVGGRDDTGIELNRAAAARMPVRPRLLVIPGCYSLFEVPEPLNTVARLAAQWFTHHLPRQAGQAADGARVF